VAARHKQAHAAEAAKGDVVWIFDSGADLDPSRLKFSDTTMTNGVNHSAAPANMSLEPSAGSMSLNLID